MILLDTHVLLWLDRNDLALGNRCRALIQEAWQQDGIGVCAITFWEVAMLTARGRITLGQAPDQWRFDWLNAGLQEMALDGAIALAATELADFHPDPADRFIVATALARGATLITADQAILSWPGPLKRQAAGE